MEQLTTDYEWRVKAAKMDVDANPGTTARYNVRSLQSVLFFQDGQRVDTIVRAVPRSMLERRLETQSLTSAVAPGWLGRAPWRGSGPPGVTEDGQLTGSKRHKVAPDHRQRR